VGGRELTREVGTTTRSTRRRTFAASPRQARVWQRPWPQPSFRDCSANVGSCSTSTRGISRVSRTSRYWPMAENSTCTASGWKLCSVLMSSRWKAELWRSLAQKGRPRSRASRQREARRRRAPNSSTAGRGTS